MNKEAVLELIRRTDGGLTLSLGGDWVTQTTLPDIARILALLDSPTPPAGIHFDCETLGRWDSLLLGFLVKLMAACDQRKIPLNAAQLPPGVRGLLQLARSVPERVDARRFVQTDDNLLSQIGRHTVNGYRDFLDLAEFIGELCLASGRMLVGQARFRGTDTLKLVQECGPNALPIISLIAILTGMILAFVGAVQLKLFGAQIFVADLVGLGMAREMGAMMTAILMAGRTGSAYAAELGSMVVNDEIDALKTSGFSPMEFLVLPRMVALLVTIPFLCIYADILGIFGGSLVTAGLFDISFPEYFIQIQNRLRLIDFEVGIMKCTVFGGLVAIAGCMRGLQCQRSATAVGVATTSAVVTGIVFIVVSDAVMTLLITALNIFKR